jgi:hypothetical protein
MANKIVLKKSSVAAKVPLSTDLEVGEIAVNLVDQKLYSKKADGTVVLVGNSTLGDVTGAASSTDNAVVRFDGTTGKVIQNSSVTIDDSNNVSGVATLNAANIVIADNATLGSSNSDSVAVNGRITTDLEPNTTGSHDIGTNGRKWRDGFFSRNLSAATLNATDVNANSAIISANSTTNALRITQVGTGNALVVEDSANPDATPFVIDANGAITTSSNITIDATTDNTGLVISGTIGANSSSVAIQTDAGGYGRMEFGGSSGAYLDFKTPNLDDFDLRIIVDTTSNKIQSAGNLEINNNSNGGTIINNSSTETALRITQTGTGNALLVEDSANPDATPFVITSAGVIGQGTTSPTTTGFSGGILSTSSSAFAPQLVFQNTTNDASSSYYILEKSRAGAIVSSGDFVGQVLFRGYDGANFIPMALIDSRVDGTPGTNDMPGRLVFSTTADGASSPTERMRIRSDGNIGFGGAGDVAVSLFNQKTISGSAFSYAFAVSSVANSTVSNTAHGYSSNIGTPAAAFTLPNIYHFTAQNTIGFGAGSAVTNQIGFFASSNLTGATNNFGFYSNIASGTGRWNFYAQGTARNYMAGVTSVGTTSDIGQLNVVGTGGGVVGASSTSSADAILRVAEPLATYLTNFKSASLQYRGTASTGTTAGISNADLGILSFTNTANALIQTNDTAPLIFATLSAERMRIDSAGSVGIGGSSFGSGAKVMFIANATTVPTTNPSGGGIMYVEGGALKYRGSSGTVTTIANA